MGVLAVIGGAVLGFLWSTAGLPVWMLAGLLGWLIWKRRGQA